MFRTFLWVLSSVLIVSTGFAAQTTLDFQNPKSPQMKSGAPIPPSEFSNQVKTMNTENHKQFKQQLDQQKNALPNPTIPTLSQVQGMTQTPPPTITESKEEPTTNATTSPQKATKQPKLLNNTEQPPPQELTQEPTQTVPNPATTTTPPLPQKPAQSESYTGFPTQSPSKGGEQKNNGGFNIQY